MLFVDLIFLGERAKDDGAVFGHSPLALVTPAIAILITAGTLVVGRTRAMDRASAHSIFHLAFPLFLRSSQAMCLL
jgi:hypothetical protein